VAAASPTGEAIVNRDALAAIAVAREAARPIPA